MLIPKTIRSALERQDLSTLFEIRDLVEHLIAEIGQPLSSEELPLERVVQQVKTIESITYRQEMVSCGKNCKGCPHGSLLVWLLERRRQNAFQIHRQESQKFGCKR